MSNHLLRRLSVDDRTAARAMRRAKARVEQPQVIVNLGEGSHRTPRAGLAGSLVDRHGWGQTLDQVDVGPLELVEELSGIPRNALDVTPVPVCEDRVEGKRAFPRAAYSRQYYQAIPGEVDIDPLKIVNAGAANRDRGRRVVCPERGCHVPWFLTESRIERPDKSA